MEDEKLASCQTHPSAPNWLFVFFAGVFSLGIELHKSICGTLLHKIKAHVGVRLSLGCDLCVCVCVRCMRVSCSMLIEFFTPLSLQAVEAE